MPSLRRLLPAPARRVARGAADATAAVGLRALLGSTPCPPIGVTMVYRARNAARVRRLLAQAGRPLAVALWALDEVPAELAALTVGQGPGGRLQLLNRATAALHIPADAWQLFCDDDVVMSTGSLCDAVRLAVLAEFDLAQPAHDAHSPRSWDHNGRHRLSWARQTRFVETGPMLMFGPRARRACLPFDDNLGMGWGSEAYWGTQLQLGAGVLDGVTMRHLDEVATAYDRNPQQEQADEVFGRLLPPAGFATLEEFQAVTGVWPVWRRRPPWASPPHPACECPI